MWKDRGQPMPFALCLGTEPGIPFVGGMSLPAFVDEGAYLGGYFGEPLDVVACKTVDLEVPATSEIVIEGLLSNVETAPEGPMGEYAGYHPGGPPTSKPLYRVTAITHRNDPILPVVIAGEPIEEDHTAQGIPSSAATLALLRERGIPASLVWCTLESANHWLVVTMPIDWRNSLDVSDEELLQRVGRIIFEESKFGPVVPKIILINDDIDPTNLRELVWAFATRNHPGPKGELIFGPELTSPLVAFLESPEKAAFRTTKVVYNCLPPADWGHRLPTRASFRASYPAALQKHVLDSWSRYGFR
jgi:4-hydroxy-3-polyprenylbenzoate decarboxylase